MLCRNPHWLPIGAALLIAACSSGPTDPPPPSTNIIVQISVSPDSSTISKGETLQFTANGRDRHGNVVANIAASWRSDDPAVATVDSSGRVTGVTIGATTIEARAGAATGHARITVITAGACNPGERPTANCPDDMSGPQFHLVYMIPKDGTDRQLDTSGAIENSWRSGERWFVAKTGRRKHVDTYQGRVDVTFVRLEKTEAQVSFSPFDAIREGLRNAGFDVSRPQQRKFRVYYDARAEATCGAADFGGSVGIIFLRVCDSDKLASSSTAPPGFLEFAGEHEDAHTLGAVHPGAPHYEAVCSNGGHVNDSPNDLMWCGPDPWTPSMVDIGGDDYFDPDKDKIPAGVTNIADSPFLVAASALEVAVARSLTPAEPGAFPALNEHLVTE